MAVVWKKLAYETDVVLKSTYDAYSILYADTDNTPAACALDASNFIGRKSSGGIVKLPKTDALAILNVEDGADVTDATNVASAGAVMESDYSGKGVIIGGTGSGTAAALAASTDGLVLMLDDLEITGLKWAAAGAGDFLANGTVPMTGDLDFDDNEAKDMIIQQVANEAAVSGYATPVVGKVLFATSELTLHICTSAA